MVFGVEVFNASKKYLHLMILAGRMSRTCGGQCGLIYRKQQKPAGNCYSVAAKCNLSVPESAAVNRLVYHVLDSVIVVAIASKKIFGYFPFSV